MNIHNKLEYLKERKNYSGHAHSIKTHLKPILSKSNELRKRWMWELLQNASDLGNEINQNLSDIAKSIQDNPSFNLDNWLNQDFSIPLDNYTKTIEKNKIDPELTGKELEEQDAANWRSGKGKKIMDGLQEKKEKKNRIAEREMEQEERRKKAEQKG